MKGGFSPRMMWFLTALALAISPVPAQATSITLELVLEYTGGNEPLGVPPWLSATFDDGGTAGSVTLTLTSNLTDQEFASKWVFNLNPILDPTALAFSHVSGVAPSPTFPQTGVNAFTAASDSFYDILFEFPNNPISARFGAGDSSVFNITGIGSLTASSFNFLSQPGGPQGPFHSAAHVQGIGPNAEGSGWIATPEPSTLILLGFGLGGLALWRKRKSEARG